MRPAPLLLGTALALALAWPARGEAVLYPASVQTDRAEVRCKPGTEPSVYLTLQLKRGDTVQVVEKLPDGWLKIVPPKGSYSWVNTRVLSRAEGPQPIWTVVVPDGTQVPVLVGSPFKVGRPDVVGTRLTRGTQVTAVGEPRTAEDGDGLWLPIMPPPGEYRYVREKDVAAVPGPTAANTTAPSGSAGAPADQGTGKPSAATPDVHVGAPVPSATTDPLLEQAEQAERSGNRLEAARLYDQLGNKYADSKHDVAMQYYSRAAWLRGSSYRPAVPPPVTEADALYQQARQYEQAGNRAEASRTYARLGDHYRDSDYKLAMQYYNRAAWLRQGLPAAPAGPAAPDARLRPVPADLAGPPAGTCAPGPAPPQPGPGPVRAVSVQMIGPGRLMRSAYWIDARATYVLETPQAQVMAYLVPQPGVDLERYVGQNVEVLGQTVPRADVRGQYMTVARVRPLSSSP